MCVSPLSCTSPLPSDSWLGPSADEKMDQVPAPGPPTLFHIRVSTIITILFAIDILLVKYSLETITYYGVSSMVLLASEFMILLASMAGTTARYSVGLIDLRRARGRSDAPSWEEKSMYLFYIDLAVGRSLVGERIFTFADFADFMKLLTYLCFFTVILLNYGLPLHILRDVYMTLRSFLSRCSDLIRYRRATRDMDALYPNATAEELHALGDQTCIICREEMAVASDVAGDNRGEGPNETPKRLACGHIFHFHCLRSWLERQQSCPTWLVAHTCGGTVTDSQS
jgi:E3 ubiquitin-protein ligase synoviolin